MGREGRRRVRERHDIRGSAKRLKTLFEGGVPADVVEEEPSGERELRSTSVA